MEIPSLIELTPFIVEKIWGGEKLKNKKALSGAQVGETWEVSTLNEGSSTFKGKTLKEMGFSQLPYLIKFIDTVDTLSVQVHPDDDYAKKHEDTLGKDECWLIMDSGVDAGVYLGLKPECNRNLLKEMLKDGRDVSAFLYFYPVKKGDFFYVPAGTVHAIGKNVTLLEVQKSSGVTYRLWDWNRVDCKTGKPRKLDIEKGLEVTVFDEQKNNCNYFKYQRELFDKKGHHQLFSHSHFTMDHFFLNSKEEKSLSLESYKNPCSLVCLEGSASVFRSNLEHKISDYHCLFIPLTGEKNIRIRGEKSGHYILVG